MALWRIRATVDDRPGFLAVLTASLALRAVNILAVQVHTTEAGAVDDFLVDAPDALTAADLANAVEKGRGRDPWVSRAQAQGLVDPPTQALGLAGRVVRDPDALGDGLRQLLGGDFRASATGTSVVWRPADERPRSGFDGGVMRLPDPHGGTYEVTRAAPGFTPAEYARAQALVDLAGAATAQPAAGAVLLLPDGSEVVLRPATPDDLPAIAAMHERCSPRTRRRRYLGGSSGPTAAQLARLLDPRRCTTLLAELPHAGDRVVAMANLVGEGTQAEVALLIEDGWQGRGIGTALLRRLGALAARVGYAALVAHAHVEDGPILRILHRIGRPSIEQDGSVVTVTLPLDSREVPAAPPGVEPAPGTG
jgi:GNAT superfamily N-acetyltransferase